MLRGLLSGRVPRAEDHFTDPAGHWRVRPAQAGVALTGSVRPTHIAATIVDLSLRGYLRIEDVAGAENPDWLLTHNPGRRPAGLARYERTLLRGRPSVRLSTLKDTKAAADAIRRVHHRLSREAITAGWLAAGPGGRDGTEPAHVVRTLRALRRDLAVRQPPSWGAHSGNGDLTGPGSTGLSLAAAGFLDTTCGQVHAAVNHGGLSGLGSPHSGSGHHGSTGNAGGGGEHHGGWSSS